MEAFRQMLMEQLMRESNANALARIQQADVDKVSPSFAFTSHIYFFGPPICSLFFSTKRHMTSIQRWSNFKTHLLASFKNALGKDIKIAVENVNFRFGLPTDMR